MLQRAEELAGRNLTQLLLLSNSRDSEGRYLHHARSALADHLRGSTKALFFPYADVSGQFDDYTARVRDALAECDIEVDSSHSASDPRARIDSADAFIVGGGNTFRLLATLQELDLLDSMREHVLSGVPYVGWSAGSVLACPTIQTTNDMPIVAPQSFAALGLVGFQINAHFTDAHPPGFQGETRRQRINEYLMANPAQSVVGLPEGDWLEVRDDDIHLRGAHAAVLFQFGKQDLDVPVGSAVHNLLRSSANG